MKKAVKIIPFLLAALLTVSCGSKDDKKSDAQNTATSVQNENQVEYIIPEISGKSLDSKLQQELMNGGYLLSIKTEYSDTVAKGDIITQNPEAGKILAANGLTLELTVSAGKKEQSAVVTNPAEDKKTEEIGENTENDENAENPETNPTVNDTPQVSDPANDGVPVPTWNGNIKWIISPQKTYDKMETFANGGYTIYSENGKYGIINSTGEPVGEAIYTNIEYCPAHGVVCHDVAEPTQLAEDLTFAPYCGCDIVSYYGTVYVYDNSRERIYMTAYDNGKFRIYDITESDHVTSTAQFPSVLYNCDADIMMYDQSGIGSISEIFEAENKTMKYGVVNGNMEVVVGYVYDGIEYANDCYMVKQNGKYGYRGTSGQYYYPCIFDEVNTAYLGFSWVKYNGKWGIIAF